MVKAGVLSLHLHSSYSRFQLQQANLLLIELLAEIDHYLVAVDTSGQFGRYGVVVRLYG